MTEKTTEEILHSSSDEFGTPQWLFDELNAVHHFTLDVCASEKNHKCERYNSILEPHKFPWRGESCFMNPPYSRGSVAEWVKLAYWASRNGQCSVVALLPARTEQPWFHDYVWGHVEDGVVLRPLRGRLKYEGGVSSARFPSIVVEWRRRSAKFIEPFPQIPLFSSEADKIVMGE
jgi:site-specific DNA-methyltransferase (adenine-specific)